MYNYDAQNINLKIEDTIEVIYLPDNPEINIDYNFLKADGYFND